MYKIFLLIILIASSSPLYADVTCTDYYWFGDIGIDGTANSQIWYTWYNGFPYCHPLDANGDISGAPTICSWYYTESGSSVSSGIEPVCGDSSGPTIPEPDPVDIVFMIDGMLVSAKANPSTGAVDASTIEAYTFPGFIHTDSDGNQCYNYYEMASDGSWYIYTSYPDGKSVGIGVTPEWYTGPTDSGGGTSLVSPVLSDDTIDLQDHQPAYVPSDTKTVTKTYQDDAGNDVSVTTTTTRNPDSSTTTNTNKTTTYDNGSQYTEETVSTEGEPAQEVSFDDSGIRSDLGTIIDKTSEIRDHTEKLSEFFEYESSDAENELSELRSKFEGLESSQESANDALENIPTDVSNFPVSQGISSYVLAPDILPSYNANPSLCFFFQDKQYCFDSYIFIQFQLIFGWFLYAATVWHIFLLFTHNT